MFFVLVPLPNDGVWITDLSFDICLFASFCLRVYNVEGDAPVPGRTCFPVRALGARFRTIPLSSYSRKGEPGLPFRVSSPSQKLPDGWGVLEEGDDLDNVVEQVDVGDPRSVSPEPLSWNKIRICYLFCTLINIKK